MKRLAISVLICLISMTAGATRQKNDRIIIDGTTWELPATPLRSLDTETYRTLKDVIGTRKFISSANFRGFNAVWHIGKNNLYLDYIEIPQSDGSLRIIKGRQLKKIFRKYRHWGKIRAEWCNGEFLIGNGQDTPDPHRPHVPRFTEERTITVNDGRVMTKE